MNITKKFICLLAVCLVVIACDPVTNSNGTSETDPSTVPTETPVDNTDANKSTAPVPNDNTATAITDQKDCEISDKHYDKNIFAVKDAAQLLCIVANESTKDKDLGDSHRVLEVLSTVDCSKIFEQTLPINRSADFPYYLVPSTYEAKNQIVAIQGFSSTHYYDVRSKQLIGPVTPQFLKEKEAVDAQSGMVKGLSVWGHYLLGRSVDFGNFAFDISDVNNPKAVLPVAEYMIPKTEEFNNLFILEAGNGRYHAFIPTTDIDAGGNMFDLDRMFAQPLVLNTKVAKNVQNNRFIVLNDSTDPNQAKKVVVDMFSKKRIDLPASVATQKTSEVLTWLNNQ